MLNNDIAMMMVITISRISYPLHTVQKKREEIYFSLHPCFAFSYSSLSPVPCSFKNEKNVFFISKNFLLHFRLFVASHFLCILQTFRFSQADFGLICKILIELINQISLILFAFRAFLFRLVCIMSVMPSATSCFVITKFNSHKNANDYISFRNAIHAQFAIRTSYVKYNDKSENERDAQ